MLTVDSVSVPVGGHQIIDDVSLLVERGSLVALLGPNGAGKTTLLRTIAGILNPSKGRVAWDGDSSTSKGIDWYRHIGYSPDRSPVVPEMTVTEYLRFMAVLKMAPSGEKSVSEVIDALTLGDVRHTRCGLLSHGFRQRVSIAQAFLSHADIILLDEPTQGLDPEQVVRLRQHLALAVVGRVIMVSSHHISELAQVASRYVIMGNGKLYSEGAVTPDLEADYLAVVGRQ